MDNNTNSNFNAQNVQPQAQPLDQQAVYGLQPQPAPYPQPEQYQKPQPAPYPQPEQYQQPYQPDAQYQPQYQQQYAQYPVQPYVAAGPYYYGQPLVDEEAAKNSKKGNILCFISLALYIAPYVFGGVLSNITNQISSIASNDYKSIEIVTGILTSLTGGSYIAAWVLAIIARVKHKNTFSKVLLWIYIGMLIVTIVSIIVVIAACSYMLKDCRGF